MLLGDILVLVRRNRLLMLVVAVMAILGASLVYSRPAASYRSEAVMAVLPTSAEGASSNPYFTSPQALGELAELTGRILSGSQQRADLGGQGVLDYTLTFQESSSSRSAAITVQAAGASPKQAQAAAKLVIHAAGMVLTQIQELSGITSTAQAGIFTVIPPEAGIPDTGDRVKSSIVVGFLIGLAGFALVALIDNVKRRGRAERPTAQTSVASEVAGSGGGDEPSVSP